LWKVMPCRLIHYCYWLGRKLCPSATLHSEASALSETLAPVDVTI